MSIINKMLQELDRRNGRAAAPGQIVHPEVRAVHVRGNQEWFWRIVAGLMLIAALWTLWVVYQLQPRSVVTELAYRAAENSRRQVAAARQSAATLREVASPAVADAMATTPAAASPAAQAIKPAPERLAVPLETLRLALTIDTPLASRKPRHAVDTSSRLASRGTPASRKPQTDAASSTAMPVRIEKRARESAPADDAERLFRQAAVQLERGRVVEAEASLRAALAADHAHQPARQTLIALDIEQGRIDDARRHLQEGLALKPSHTPYAIALARIYVDRGEFKRALEVLDNVGEADRSTADFHAMHGAVLLRMSRYADAAEAYRQALGSGVQAGSSWVGLGVALDALGSNAEAAEAFRRGIATGTLAGEVRAYAEQRAAQLR